ncbi:MAG: PQQ-binding-like beta-propeller repeat protein [Planctomycetota bacterium]|nr:PQQ-binding-like beta-propeller repeat protein [Planctomycetota bacterium]
MPRTPVSHAVAILAAVACGCASAASHNALDPDDPVSPYNPPDPPEWCDHASCAEGSTWTHFAGAPHRGGRDAAGPRVSDLASPSWVFSTDSAGNPVRFLGQSGVVVTRDLVIAVGIVILVGGPEPRVFAIDRRTGKQAWSAFISQPVANSWSTPVVDESNGTVIVTQASSLRALRLRTGATAWTTALDRQIINASPLVTTDLNHRDRVFITGYDGFGDTGKLYCINVDRQLGTANPYSPGDIVWTATIGGSVGNTPAYARGIVYVATMGNYNAREPGQIRAYSALGDGSAPLWTFVNPSGFPFSGGVTVHPPPPISGMQPYQPFVYAASYNFEQACNEPANLVKVNGLTGQMQWQIGCERTSSTPIVLDDGRILLSSGISGITFGSRPGLELFRDLGSGAIKLWDSSLATWTDDNEDGCVDIGESFAVGGWTHQPAVRVRNGRTIAFAGTLLPVNDPNNGPFYEPCTDLHAIDLGENVPPSGDDFVLGSFSGAGTTPAIADRNLYTVGAGGLYAFGPPPPDLDVNGDFLADVDDLYAFEAGVGDRDVNQDGIVDKDDYETLVNRVRCREVEFMTNGRR